MFEGKVDARRPTDAESAGPFDNRLRAHHAGRMEEIDVARPAESVAEVDRTVSDAPLRVDETPKAVGPVEIPAAVITHVGVDPPALEEGDGGEDLEDRSGRKGHLDGPMKQRMPRIVGEPLPGLRVGDGRGAEIEPRCAGGHEHGAALHIQGHDAAARRARASSLPRTSLGPLPARIASRSCSIFRWTVAFKRQLDIAARTRRANHLLADDFAVAVADELAEAAQSTETRIVRRFDPVRPIRSPGR